ncbi:MAG: synthase subunit [Gammaproteobacteria bacterium]|jgi:F-type H+-transporting ATPase subunit b|nr:synthase subunit [Gammaproteobacteria bacterium]
MEINLTLIGQLITFAIVVWFTMKYVWPPLTQAISQRQKQIADGLAAAEEGQRERLKATEDAAQLLAQAKQDAAQILDQAHKRGNALIEQAKVEALQENQRLLATAKSEIAQEVNAAKEALQQQLGQLIISGAEKILKREVDAAANQAVINEIINTQLN